MVRTCGSTGEYFRRMLKKARLLTHPILARRGAHHLGYVEPLSDARTLLGERCVLAHRGWTGEKSDFFSILLKEDTRGRCPD